jgi:hypothetical protein
VENLVTDAEIVTIPKPLASKSTINRRAVNARRGTSRRRIYKMNVV